MKCSGRSGGKVMKKVPALVLAGGKRGFIPRLFTALSPLVSIFSMQVILYIYEFMDKNRKEENTGMISGQSVVYG